MFIAAEKCQTLKKILYFLLKLCVRALQFRNGTYLPPEKEKEHHILLVLMFLRTLWRDRHTGTRVDSCSTRLLTQTTFSEVTQHYQVNQTSMGFGFI